MHAAVIAFLIQQPQIWISAADYTGATIQTGTVRFTLWHHNISGDRQVYHNSVF
jgi:hypothetical protein